MIATFLLCIVGGVAMALAVSRTDHVTLRWQRLGAIVALCLLAVAGVTVQVTEARWSLMAGVALGIALVGTAAHLTLAQLGRRTALRALAGAVLVACVVGAAALAQNQISAERVIGPWTLRWVMLLGAGLLGGSVMAMLLGHAYLTAGDEMTQKPFERLVIMLGVLLVLRAVASGIAWWAWRTDAAEQGAALMQRMYIIARFAVGLGGPMVFTAMAWDCVRRRANQSATGILYVTIILIIIGEGLALVLMDATGHAF